MEYSNSDIGVCQQGGNAGATLRARKAHLLARGGVCLLTGGFDIRTKIYEEFFSNAPFFEL